MPISAGTLLGPYEVLSPLGAGGMGEVYRARDARLGREVAIKVLPPSFAQDAERLRRFEQEARAAGLLNHPNITAVYDIGTSAGDGAPYVVQELLEGEALRSALAGGPLSPRRAIDYALQIAHGLAAAHEKGIVHRDLKPENLFVTKDGRVKILDFGLAKLTTTDESGGRTNLPTATAGTEAGVVLGTIGYMSPEQVRGKPADARSDIFSFGAILYEMLSGKRAFHGDSAADTMSAILREDPPDLSITNQSISPGLERIIRHCLEKNPEQRFHSAHDLAFDLEALSTVSAPGRSSAAVDLARPPRRWLWPSVAALLAIAAAIAAFQLGRRKVGEMPSGAGLYVQLTYRQEPIFNARFAPDGKTIVYSAAPQGNSPRIFSVRQDFPGASPRSGEAAQLLAVSSRGELAVLTHPKYLRHSLFVGTLARMPLEGGAPREVLDHVREVDWSPDGSDLAVIHEVDGKDRLEFPVGKVLCEAGGYLSNLRFSRDGRYIAFFEHPIKFDDRGLIAIVDLQGKKTVLSDGYWAEEGLAWSARGDEIMFSAGSAYNNFNVYAISLSGKRRIALESAGGLTIQDVSRDGRWLASRDDLYRETLLVAPGQDHERDLSWLDLTYAVALTPDNRTFLFTEENGALGPNYSACLRGTDGSAVVRLGDGTATDISRDGKWALAVIPSVPQQRLVLYPTGPGAPRRPEPGPIVSYETAQLFPDGQKLFVCGHEAATAVRCYTQPIGGKPRPITPPGSTDGFVSPDGRRVLVREGGSLRLYPAEGGAGRTVPGTTAEDLVIRWTVDGRSVLASSSWEVPVHVERIDLETGKREPYRTLGPSNLTGALQIAPVAIGDDGTTYAYTVRRMSSHLFLVDGAR